MAQDSYAASLDPVSPSVLASWIRALCQTVRGYGCDPLPLMAGAGLDANRLNVPEARFPMIGVRRFWRLAIDATGDPLLGLRLGEEVQPATLHGLGLAILACGSLSELMSLVARYATVLSTTMYISLRDDAGGSALVVNTLGGSEMNHAARIAMLAFVYRQACKLSQRQVIPSFVTLGMPPAPGTERLDQYFHVPVTLGAEADAIGFTYADTIEPYASANTMLVGLNEKAIRDYLSRLERSLFSDRVLTQIQDMLPSGEPKLVDVATHLGLSVRTLQRKLRQENQSFQALLDQVRRTLASDWLSHGNLAVVEIGYRLGFSDPSNFCRACHRWFCCSPSEYRQRCLQLVT